MAARPASVLQESGPRSAAKDDAEDLDVKGFVRSTLEDPNFPTFWRDHGSAVIEACDGIGRLAAQRLYRDETDRLRREIGTAQTVDTPEGAVPVQSVDVDATVAARIIGGARDAFRIAADWTADLAAMPGFRA